MPKPPKPNDPPDDDEDESETILEGYSDEDKADIRKAATARVLADYWKKKREKKETPPPKKKSGWSL